MIVRTGDSKDLLLNLPWLIPPSGADREHPAVNKPGGLEGLLLGLCFRTQAVRLETAQRRLTFYSH